MKVEPLRKNYFKILQPERSWATGIYFPIYMSNLYHKIHLIFKPIVNNLTQWWRDEYPLIKYSRRKCLKYLLGKYMLEIFTSLLVNTSVYIPKIYCFPRAIERRNNGICPNGYTLRSLVQITTHAYNRKCSTEKI